MAPRYPLHSLLVVCRHHEKKAERGLVKAKDALVQAQQALDLGQKAWKAYGIWRAEETERRYDGLMGQPQSRTELDAFKIGLAALKSEEARLEKQVLYAREKVEICTQAVEAARELLKLSQKKTIKFTLHKDMWLEEVRRENERREEVELEDFSQQQL